MRQKHIGDKFWIKAAFNIWKAFCNCDLPFLFLWNRIMSLIWLLVCSMCGSCCLFLGHCIRSFLRFSNSPVERLVKLYLHRVLNLWHWITPHNVKGLQGFGKTREIKKYYNWLKFQNIYKFRCKFTRSKFAPSWA